MLRSWRGHITDKKFSNDFLSDGQAVDVSAHKANFTMDFAEKIGIKLIYLPPYSPDLNPIEFIWKSIKKAISKNFIVDVNHMQEIIHRNFQKFSSKMRFAKGWIEKFLNNKLEKFSS